MVTNIVYYASGSNPKRSRFSMKPFALAMAQLYGKHTMRKWRYQYSRLLMLYSIIQAKTTPSCSFQTT